MWKALAAIVLVVCGCASVEHDPSQTTTTQPVRSYVVLTGDGTIELRTGEDVHRRASVSGIETIDHVVIGDGIVATRGRDILVLPLDGRAPTTLLRHPSELRFATRSSNGKLLAFSADGGVWLASMNADGTFGEARRISSQFGYDPSFSSDGRFIYFEGNGGLKRFERATGAIQAFVAEQREAHTVRCSPDGRFIAFSCDRALYVYRTEDGGVRQLTSGRAYDRFASFVGDDEIVFFRESAGAAGRSIRSVMSIRADGSNEHELYRGDVELACAVQARGGNGATGTR
jgi:Tol biopolymer transport system component